MFANTVRPTKVAAVVGSRASGASARPTVMLVDAAEALEPVPVAGAEQAASPAMSVVAAAAAIK